MKQHHPHNPAFVLGNGTSRLAINAQSLLDQGTVYGCNAQYREFSPHFLIAVDLKMINEIVETGYHLKNTVWTNPNKALKVSEGLNFFNPHRGWSSGPTALFLAAAQGHQDIYILGFDYEGTQGKINNVYADTKNYRSSKDTATFFGNWLTQTGKVIREFKNVNFHRVIGINIFVPEKLKNLPNLDHVTYEKFIERFNLAKIK